MSFFFHPVPALACGRCHHLIHHTTGRATGRAKEVLHFVVPLHGYQCNLFTLEAGMTEVTTIPRQSFWRYVIDRNPFYLLSAVCMLFGCIALTNSSSWVSIRPQRLLILIATLNFYELLL